MIELRQLIFSIAVTCTGRVFVIRDRLFRRISRGEHFGPSRAEVSRHVIQSGDNLLDAVFVKPDSSATKASLLICHGIGETVQHWLAVQQLLAASGVASLVFDYSGYGRSSGFFNARQSEEDVVSAFFCLQKLTASLPVSVLGFSLGSGIAAAILSRVPIHRLLLCAAFTSLRKAAVSIGVPKVLAFLVPPIWDAEVALRNCPVSVLVVQGEKDRLFSVNMAKELRSFCNSESRLVIIPKLTHNEPFYRPQTSYWEVISSRLL